MKRCEEKVRRGDTVRIDGKLYKVTMVEHWGFFVKGRQYIVLHSDNYEIVERSGAHEKD